MEERRSGLEASEERPLSVEDLWLGGPSEGLRLTPSSSAMLPFARLPGGRYRDRPSSDACCSCCWPLQAPCPEDRVSALCHFWANCSQRMDGMQMRACMRGTV